MLVGQVDTPPLKLLGERGGREGRGRLGLASEETQPSPRARRRRLCVLVVTASETGAGRRWRRLIRIAFA
jgi:hypothetical protein